MSAPRLPAHAALAALLACATAAMGQWDPQRIQSAYKGATVFIEAEHDSLFQPLGTGVVVSKEGHVLTAKHIFRCGDCERAKFWGRIGDRKAEPRIPLQLGTEAAGNIDAALIRLAAPVALLKPPPVAVPKANPGWELYVLGFPHQVPFSVGAGIISSLDEDLGSWRTTLPLSPGYSGGPVFDRSGSLVGIAVGGLRGLDDMKTVLPLSAMRGLLKEANIVLGDGARRVKVFIDGQVLGQDQRASRLRGRLVEIGSRLTHVELTDAKGDAQFSLKNLILSRYLDAGLEVQGTLVRPDGTEVLESGICDDCADDPEGPMRALSEFLNQTLLHHEHGPYRLIDIVACEPQGDLIELKLSWLQGLGLEKYLYYEVGDWRPDKPPGMTGLFVRVHEARGGMVEGSGEATFRQVQGIYRPKACTGEPGKNVLMPRAARRKAVETERHANFRTIARP